MRLNIVALGLLAVVMAGCSSENVHRPDVDAPIELPKEQTLDGELISSIPDFPDFPGVHNQVGCKVKWESERECTLDLDAFDLYVSVMDMDLNIGSMHIEGVEAAWDADGNRASLYCEEFQCQAGKYYTTGSMSGECTLKPYTLKFTVLYKPGSMPFTVKSEFTYPQE